MDLRIFCDQFDGPGSFAEKDTVWDIPYMVSMSNAIAFNDWGKKCIEIDGSYRDF